MTRPVYKRLLLKLSGEQLAGEFDGGIDADTIANIAREIKTVTDEGVQVAIMVGGGNYIRGAQLAVPGIQRTTADFMGMLGTMINGLAVTDIFNSVGVPARVLTNIWAQQLADPFTQRRAINHLEKGRVVVVGGGVGRPYLTTDTAAVSLALELQCDVVCKLTKVDGVYDKDPIKFSDAKRFEHLSFQQAIENPDVLVMDKAALGLAMEQNKPVLVFNFNQSGNVRRAAFGESVGTLLDNKD